MSLIAPTSAVAMGGPVLAKVGYGKYLRFILALLFVSIVGFVAFGAAF